MTRTITRSEHHWLYLPKHGVLIFWWSDWLIRCNF
jgi:hypothetical protein